MSRIGISKKIRFEIFKRDGFKCQYCNASPPNVTLEVDHIVPISKGGTNQEENLITACFDCNRGKSNRELNSINESLSEKTLRKKIALEQYREFQNVLIEQDELINLDISIVEKVFKNTHKNWCFTDKFKLSIRMFIEKIGIEETVNSMRKAVSRCSDPDDALSYFCGICWNKIKSKGF
jgi:hypothetical protein